MLAGVVLGLLLLAACRPAADTAPAGTSATRPAASIQVPGRGLPRIGLAVKESARAWCAELVSDSGAALEPGRPLRVVFAGPAPVTMLRGRVRGQHEGQCPAEFPQPRWIDYEAYDVELTDPFPAEGGSAPTVALLVVSETPWTRAANGAVRADLDGDGRLEEARQCTADEGEHWTVWTQRPDGEALRRWHEYYDWGAVTDPTCRPGEDGR
ncbi:MAG TPA: hypothetical protein VFU40_00325 [Gemmatimonadales bacterium]|nr:hypothetical protein [Gemmatimonadales bacterium]